MATYYGVNATKRDNQAIPQLIGPGEVKGRLLCAYDEFTLTADLVGGTDIIKMMKLPSGARVHDVVLYSDDLDASGGTLDVGWAANTVDLADADGFLATVDVATAAAGFIMSDDQPTRPGLFKQFSPLGGETQIQIAPNGDTDATSGTIKLAVYYAID